MLLGKNRNSAVSLDTVINMIFIPELKNIRVEEE